MVLNKTACYGIKQFFFFPSFKMMSKIFEHLSSADITM